MGMVKDSRQVQHLLCHCACSRHVEMHLPRLWRSTSMVRGPADTAAAPPALSAPPLPQNRPDAGPNSLMEGLVI